MKEKFFKSIVIIMIASMVVMSVFLCIGIDIVPIEVVAVVTFLMVIPCLILFVSAGITCGKMEDKIDIEIERYKKYTEFLDEFIKEQEENKK